MMPLPLVLADGSDAGLHTERAPSLHWAEHSRRLPRQLRAGGGQEQHRGEHHRAAHARRRGKLQKATQG